MPQKLDKKKIVKELYQVFMYWIVLNICDKIYQKSSKKNFLAKSSFYALSVPK